MSSVIGILDESIIEQDVIDSIEKDNALSMFNAFVKHNVSDLTISERWHIARYKTSCLFNGAMYIPRVKKKNDYMLTILRVLSAYFQYSNAKLKVTKISKSKIFFSSSIRQFHDIERLKRLLYSEIITINSIELVNENGLLMFINPLEKTIKVKIRDAWGYSELAFENFSIQDILMVKENGREVERVIANAGEYDGKQVPGTISKVDFKFVAGLHYVVPNEPHKTIIIYRYQKFAKMIDRFIKYDIKHGINWDNLVHKSSYNMIG